MDPLSLRELNILIKNCIEDNFSSSYWIIAEISEMRINQKGHCYLELVEKAEDEILAKIRATIWSYSFRNLSGWFETITGESLKPGLKILANVIVSFHEIFGLSLNIRDIDPSYTIGERARRRQEILAKLKEDGIAEMNKEIPLPVVPQRIAIIASPTSAGYQDFLDQLEGNPYNYRFYLVLYQAIMQGKEAERSIIDALLKVNRSLEEFDLLVIIRGGGASLDLECFDSYDLAAHVAQFPIPVITGIGHERDETITDLVANTKLKTPTAVAEFLITGCRQFDEKIEEFFIYIADYAKSKIQEERHSLEDISQKFRLLTWAKFDRNLFALRQVSEKFKYGVENKIRLIESVIDNNRTSFKNRIQQVLYEQKILIKHLESKLILMRPDKILDRGFSITRQNSRVIKDSRQIKADDIIETEFSNGKVKSKII